jgi:gamma-glutamyl hercynylcysteine S-oxide synthase
MTDKKPAKIFNDTPSPEDTFHFAAYAKTISDIIAAKHNETPLTIGIFGSWGSGKTSLMQLIRRNLDTYKKDENFRRCKTVWFQAWKYADEDKILAALIEVIFRTMEEDNLFEDIKATIEKVAKAASPRQGVAFGRKGD